MRVLGGSRGLPAQGKRARIGMSIVGGGSSSTLRIGLRWLATQTEWQRCWPGGSRGLPAQAERARMGLSTACLSSSATCTWIDPSREPCAASQTLLNTRFARLRHRGVEALRNRGLALNFLHQLQQQRAPPARGSTPAEAFSDTVARPGAGASSGSDCTRGQEQLSMLHARDGGQGRVAHVDPPLCSFRGGSRLTDGKRQESLSRSGPP